MSLLPGVIEHTNLNHDIVFADIQKLYDEAEQWKFGGICVPPCWVKKTRSIISDPHIKLVTVVGFPCGYHTTPVKIEEIRRAIEDGADALDVVINKSQVIQGDWRLVEQEIEHVVTSCKMKDKVVKLIIESEIIPSKAVKKIIELSNRLKPDFIKTCTGFFGPPVSVNNVKIIRRYLDPDIKIKASGGIHSKELAIDLLEAGADVLGASKSLHFFKA